MWPDPCVQTAGQAASLQAVWPGGVQLMRRQQAGAALQARQAPAGVPGLLHRPPGDQEWAALSWLQSTVHKYFQRIEI